MLYTSALHKKTKRDDLIQESLIFEPNGYSNYNECKTSSSYSIIFTGDFRFLTLQFSVKSLDRTVVVLNIEYLSLSLHIESRQISD